MYLSLPEAATRLGFSHSTLRRWRDQGLIRVYRATPTSHPRVKLADIEALMKTDIQRPREVADFDTWWEQHCAAWHAAHPEDRSRRRKSKP